MDAIIDATFWLVVVKNRANFIVKTIGENTY